MNKKIDNDVVEHSEGDTKFLSYSDNHSDRGPASKTEHPFYNPAMELNRDLSILVCQWIINNSDRKIEICDGLSASGVRGLRIKNEIDGDFNIVLNDWNKKSYELIKKNRRYTGLEHIEVTNKNLNTLLSEKKFDYIDIDPFGTPVAFVDSAMRSIKDQGVLACTATDTAALCGVYPNVSLRRYGVRSYHNFLMKETAVRILLRFLMKEAAKHDKTIKPLLSHSSDHYFRIYVKVLKGAKKADRDLKKISNMDAERYFFSDNNKTTFESIWSEKIHEKEMIQEIKKYLLNKKLNTKNAIYQLLEHLEDEVDFPAFFYYVDEITSALKISPPKRKTFFRQIEKEGYRVCRTHFNPIGFKTKAPKEIVKKVFLKNQP
ncbi:MAG: tRNA (guanine(10)-N(2))-dimethyltransferase [Candidatus Thermoplasmatota archaeon]